MPSPNYLIVISGPTASGKTSLAIRLARHFSAPILSADSRQFYREMRIGNARPTEEELAEAPHYFIADRSIREPLSAGAFAREAHAFLANHYKEHQWAIVVGGSGLFLRALTQGLDQFPKVSEAVRTKVDDLYEEEGLEGLQSAVAKEDPVYFAEVDTQNPARLRRALEVCWSGEQPYSFYRRRATKELPFTPIFLQTHWSRPVLYDRINQRVNLMVDAGLEAEARALLPLREESALRTVGYQEWFPYFDGKYERETAIELIKRNSRRYAKRQLTWLRRDGHWKHIYQADLRSALAYIQLVQGEQLTIQVLKADSLDQWRRATQLSRPPKWEERVVGLIGNSDKALQAWCRSLRSARGEAVLTHWQWIEGHPLANSILLHECCHGLALDRIFARVSAADYSFFKSQAWQLVPAAPQLPSRLEQAVPSGEWLVWELKDQEW